MLCCQMARTSRKTQDSIVTWLAVSLAASFQLWPARAADVDAMPLAAERDLEQAAASVPEIRLGPLVFGMGLEEIQAAVPGASWEVTSRSKFTGRAFGIVAADAIDFGGRRMEVRAREEKYDRDIVLTSRTTESSAQACEQAGLAFLGALESSAGTLQAGTSSYGEAVSFGRGSTALFTAFDEHSRLLTRKRAQRANVDRMGLATKREAERLEVKGTVTYDARSAENCVCTVTVISWRQRPPFEVIAYDESRVVRRMSIGDRHRLASQLNIAADEIVVPQQCQVSRQTGAVLVCHPGANATADPDIKGVAGRYAGAVAFDLSGLDRDDPQPVLVEIPVRVARSDVRPLSFTGPVVPMSEVAFDAVPPGQEIQRVFPSQALRDGVGAVVETACEVQSDGSLVCRRPTVRQTNGSSDFASGFERAVEKLLPSYRAGPFMKNGTPSAGAVFGMAVAFKVAE